jgi:nitroimidazol reductase NimA-like FMN-containing flavoprotein (pyridoxamine 5'-phosphate oxidase superfamily)
MSNIPTFRDLLRDESLAVLTRNHVGRLAFSFHDSVDIRPIHYVYENGWIFGRTSPGEKLVTLRHNQWVAFEVDEIEGPFDWVSVIVRGSFFPTDPDGSEQQQKFHDRAVAAIRKLNPAVFTDEDPTQFRTQVFAIHVDSLTGKSCSMEE